MINSVNNTPNFKGTFHVYQVGGKHEYDKLAWQLDKMQGIALTKDNCETKDYSGVNDTFTLITKDDEVELDAQIFKVISDFTGWKMNSHFDYKSKNDFHSNN